MVLTKKMYYLFSLVTISTKFCMELTSLNSSVQGATLPNLFLNIAEWLRKRCLKRLMKHEGTTGDGHKAIGKSDYKNVRWPVALNFLKCMEKTYKAGFWQKGLREFCHEIDNDTNCCFRSKANVFTQ